MDNREQVAAAARRLAAEGLLVGTAGNVSLREDDRIAVTATGVVLRDCAPEQVSVLSTAAKCWRVTCADLRARPAPRRVRRHGRCGRRTHPCAVLDRRRVRPRRAPGDPLPAPAARRTDPGRAVRHLRHAELATNVRDALADRQAALMANHGSVAIGGSLDKAVENALLLEWLATLHHRASELGNPKILTDERAGRRHHAGAAAQLRHHLPGQRRLEQTPRMNTRRSHEDRHGRRPRPRRARIGVESVPEGSEGSWWRPSGSPRRGPPAARRSC